MIDVKIHEYKERLPFLSNEGEDSNTKNWVATAFDRKIKTIVDTDNILINIFYNVDNWREVYEEHDGNIVTVFNVHMSSKDLQPSKESSIPVIPIIEIINENTYNVHANSDPIGINTFRGAIDNVVNELKKEIEKKFEVGGFDFEKEIEKYFKKE